MEGMERMEGMKGMGVLGSREGGSGWCEKGVGTGRALESGKAATSLGTSFPHL